MDTTREELLARTVHNLTLHPPEADEIGERMDTIRETAISFAAVIIANGIPSREMSLAITDLESTVQWAIASLARNQ